MRAIALGSTTHDRNPPRGLRRRELLQGVATLALLAGCERLPLLAPAKRVPRIAVLSLYRSDDPMSSLLLGSLQQGLRALGYVEGQTIVIDYRYGEASPEHLAEQAADLVRGGVDVIVVANTQAIQAAKSATTTIPIVMASGNDPIGTGLVSSLARPGGNVTGISAISPQLSPKRLELIKEVVPSASRIAVLWNGANAAAAQDWRQMQPAAQLLNVQLQSLDVRDLNDFEAALAAAVSERADALTTLPDAILSSQRERIVEFAAQNRLPAIYYRADYVYAGGLMAYGVSYADLWRHSASHVDKILKGARPADLPVEQPTKFDFVISLTTARTLGLTIPPATLLQATEVL